MVAWRGQESRPRQMMCRHQDLQHRRAPASGHAVHALVPLRPHAVPLAGPNLPSISTLWLRLLRVSAARAGTGTGLLLRLLGGCRCHEHT